MWLVDDKSVVNLGQWVLGLITILGASATRADVDMHSKHNKLLAKIIQSDFNDVLSNCSFLRSKMCSYRNKESHTQHISLCYFTGRNITDTRGWLVYGGGE